MNGSCQKFGFKLCCQRFHRLGTVLQKWANSMEFLVVKHPFQMLGMTGQDMLVATVQSCLASSLRPCFPIFRFRQGTKLHWATGRNTWANCGKQNLSNCVPLRIVQLFLCKWQMLNVKATSKISALKHQRPVFKCKGTSLPYKNYSSQMHASWNHPIKNIEGDHQRMLPRLSWETERPKTKCAYIYIYIHTSHLSFCPNELSIIFIMHPPRNQHRPWREEKHGICKFVLVAKFAFEVQ